MPPTSFLGTPATAPGPLGPDMLREFGLIRRDPLAFLERTWRRYGDVVQFPIPRPPSYLVNEPDAVRRVLVDNARAYGKSTIQYRALSLVTGEGLLTADGDSWRRQRRLVQPAFHHQTLAAVSSHVEQAASALTQAWSGSGEVEIEDAMMQAALDVVGRALFGSDLSGDAAALTSATLEALDVVIARARVPITPPSWLPTPANRRLSRANRALDGAVSKMVAERRADAVPGTDMLGLLVSARDEDGVGLTDQEIRNQMVTFIVAGHETVATALTWALALLAEHPDVQTQVSREVVAAGDDLRWDRLSITRAVFDEAMRLYPPAWLITRQALADDTLAGTAIPAGALIILSPWLLHRHPARWDRPEAFLPERFASDDLDRRAFIPFGAGPRMCIGRDFAYVEGVLLLARLCAAFEFAPLAGASRPPANPLVTVRPVGGLRLAISRRG